MNTGQENQQADFQAAVFFWLFGLFFRFRHRLFFLFRFLPQQRRYRRRCGQAFPQLVNGRNPFVRTDLQGMEQRGLDMRRKLFRHVGRHQQIRRLPRPRRAVGRRAAGQHGKNRRRHPVYVGCGGVALLELILLRSLRIPPSAAV